MAKETGFLKSYTIYRALPADDGTAARFEYAPDKQCVFLEMARQKGPASQGERATFDWENKVTIKLALADLGEFIAVLEKRQKGCGPNQDGRFKGLFHQSRSRSVSINFEASERGGWHLRVGDTSVGVKRGDNKPMSLSQGISNAEGSVLLVLLRRAVEAIFAW